MNPGSPFSHFQPRRWRIVLAGLSIAVADLHAAETAPPAASPAPATFGAASTEAQSRLDRSGWLGVFLRDAVDGGIEVVALVPRGPADRGGLAPGDVLVSVDGQRLIDRDDLGPALAQRRRGETVAFTLIRRGQTAEREVELGSRPDAPVAVLPQWAAPAPAYRHVGGFEAVGLECASITPELRRHYGAPAAAGVLVTRVASGTPAAAANVRVGDVLVRLNGDPVIHAESLPRSLKLMPGSGRGVEFAVVRAGSPRTLSWSPTPGTAHSAAGAAAVAPALAERDGDGARRQEIERLRRRLAELERELDAARDDAE